MADSDTNAAGDQWLKYRRDLFLRSMISTMRPWPHFLRADRGRLQPRCAPPPPPRLGLLKEGLSQTDPLPPDIISKRHFTHILCRLVIGFRNKVRHDLRLAHIFMAGQAT